MRLSRHARLTHRQFLKWCCLAVGAGVAAAASPLVAPPKQAFATPTNFTDDVYISPGKLGIGISSGAEEAIHAQGNALLVAAQPAYKLRRSSSPNLYLELMGTGWGQGFHMASNAFYPSNYTAGALSDEQMKYAVAQGTYSPAAGILAFDANAERWTFAVSPKVTAQTQVGDPIIWTKMLELRRTCMSGCRRAE